MKHSKDVADNANTYLKPKQVDITRNHLVFYSVQEKRNLKIIKVQSARY